MPAEIKLEEKLCEFFNNCSRKHKESKKFQREVCQNKYARCFYRHSLKDSKDLEGYFSKGRIIYNGCR